MGGGSETGTPSGKHCKRRRLLEQDAGRQDTPKRGPDLDAGVPTGSAPANRIGKASQEEGEQGEMGSVPLIFLDVIRLTEVTEHHAYSFFSFLYHTTRSKSYI